MVSKDHDPFINDPLIINGVASVDIVVYSVHVGCLNGNLAGNEVVMSKEYYDGELVHLEAANFLKGDLIPPNQDCTTCGIKNGLVYLGSDKI